MDNTRLLKRPQLQTSREKRWKRWQRVEAWTGQMT
jgi:hypothetical protein